MCNIKRVEGTLDGHIALLHAHNKVFGSVVNSEAAVEHLEREFNKNCEEAHEEHEELAQET